MILRSEPHPFDLNVWRAYLADMRAEPKDAHRDTMIAHAETHIGMLEGLPKKTPADAA